MSKDETRDETRGHTIPPQLKPKRGLTKALDLRYLFCYSRNNPKVLNYISFFLNGREIVVKRCEQFSTKDPGPVRTPL
jgi:hypothetical protein